MVLVRLVNGPNKIELVGSVRQVSVLLGEILRASQRTSNEESAGNHNDGHLSDQQPSIPTSSSQQPSPSGKPKRKNRRKCRAKAKKTSVDAPLDRTPPIPVPKEEPKVLTPSEKLGAPLYRAAPSNNLCTQPEQRVASRPRGTVLHPFKNDLNVMRTFNHAVEIEDLFLNDLDDPRLFDLLNLQTKYKHVNIGVFASEYMALLGITRDRGLPTAYTDDYRTFCRFMDLKVSF